jgi:hypothetical protein
LANSPEKGAINRSTITNADFTIPYDNFLDSGEKNSGWGKKCSIGVHFTKAAIM